MTDHYNIALRKWRETVSPETLARLDAEIALGPIDERIERYITDPRIRYNCGAQTTPWGEQ